MSTILAFDTHGAHISVALRMDGRVAAERFTAMKRGQVEYLFEHIKAVLDAANVDKQGIHALGVGVGPGNFTGLRIAIAAAQGIAHGLDIPTFGVTSLAALAHLDKGAVAVAAAAAGRFYVHGAKGEIILADTSDVIALCADRPIAANEDVAAALGLPSVQIVAHPALAIAQIAETKLVEGHPPAPLSPLYVKPPDAAPPKITPPRVVMP